MRRRAYPYTRYLIKDKKLIKFREDLKNFIEKSGFPIVKYDEKNEGNGTLIISVNKKIREFLKQKKPPGHLEMLLRELPVDMSSFRDMDMESQRIGLEFYLWQIEEGILLEVFIFPYMEHFNIKEIYRITESKKEEITDWILCEKIWENFIPMLNKEFDIVPIQYW